MRFVLVITGLLLSLSFSVRAEPYPMETYTLSNGLTVIFSRNDGAPVITQALFYKAGAMDEAAGKSGVAHFLEHLMFKGRNKDYSSRIDRIGGRNNAYTSHDVTVYYSLAAADKMETLIRMESERMGNLSFSRDEFATERDVIMEERTLRLEGSARAKFIQRVNEMRWYGHPYAAPTIGRKREFLSITPADVRDFYDRYYVPNNAVLVLSGNFDTVKAKALIKEHYGRYKAKEVRREVVDEAVRPAKLEITTDDPRLNEDLFAVFFNAPQLSAADNGKAAALMLAAEILGGQGDNSRLYQKLVVERALATDVSVWYGGFTRAGGTLGITVSPSDGRHAGKIREIVFAELEKIKKKGIPVKKLDMMKKVFMAEFVYDREDPFGTAQVIGMSAIMGYDINGFENDIGSVSSADVKAAMADILENRTRTVAYISGGGE